MFKRRQNIVLINNFDFSYQNKTANIFHDKLSEIPLGPSLRKEGENKYNPGKPK